MIEVAIAIVIAIALIARSVVIFKWSRRGLLDSHRKALRLRSRSSGQRTPNAALSAVALAIEASVIRCDR